jgi:NADP-dependent 3-hydroxy acid dehydrogenase YdfG
MAVPTDLRDETEIAQLFEAIREQWGGVDVLVNSAGISRKSLLVDGDAADWREMWQVNVLALSICTREAVRDMRRRGDNGHVIHIGSMSGHRVGQGEGSGMYAATKHAVVALTEKLRRELRSLQSDIRVTAISPGFVETEMAERFHGSEEAARELYSQYEVLQPEDIAAAVLYALSSPPHVQVHDILVRPTNQET